MSFDWSDYLELATKLSEQAKQSNISEAKMRCSVSRAYYSAYCTAYEFLKANRIPIKKKPKKNPSDPEPSMHANVIYTFSTLNTAGKEVSRILERLHPKRKEADYKKDKPPNDMIVITSITFADLLLKELPKVAIP